MTLVRDAWLLPSPSAFLGEVEAAAESGLALVADDPEVLAGWQDDLLRRLRERHWSTHALRAEDGIQPAPALGTLLGCPPTIEALVSDGLREHIVVVDLSVLADDARSSWRLFAERFSERRRARSGGLALVFCGVDERWRGTPGLAPVEWADRLRRVDVSIWADLHAPPDRPEPLASLAAALAVELCVWRLDLAAEIAAASRGDLLDPLGWLSRRDERPVQRSRSFGGRIAACPIWLLREEDFASLERRVWRAQLIAFFPWLEELRQQLVERHRHSLRIDEHLEAIGVTSIEEMELGSLATQLWSTLPRRDHQVISALARIRNDLAHRSAAAADDLDLALSAAR